MTDARQPVADVFGLAPYGETAKILATGAVQGAGAFLKALCMPALEECGLFLRDKVSILRRQNSLAVIMAAQEIIDQQGGILGRSAPPRLLLSVIENGSWAEAADIQRMWGGLLVSSSSHDGDDESNLIFIDLLSRLTSSEARLLNHACQRAQKEVLGPGLVGAKSLYAELGELKAILHSTEVGRIDLALDHLHSLQLIALGFHQPLKYEPRDPRADITPTPLALNLFARCQGSPADLKSFFKLKEPPDDE